MKFEPGGYTESQHGKSLISSSGDFDSQAFHITNRCLSFSTSILFQSFWLQATEISYWQHKQLGDHWKDNGRLTEVKGWQMTSLGNRQEAQEAEGRQQNEM